MPNGGGEAASACKKFDKTELLEGSAPWTRSASKALKDCVALGATGVAGLTAAAGRAVGDSHSLEGHSCKA